MEAQREANLKLIFNNLQSQAAATLYVYLSAGYPLAAHPLDTALLPTGFWFPFPTKNLFYVSSIDCVSAARGTKQKRN